MKRLAVTTSAVSLCAAAILSGVSCGSSGSSARDVPDGATSVPKVDGGDHQLDASGGVADSGDAATSDDAATDAGAPDPCGDAALCERFDSYGSVPTIADKQTLGPWSASLAAGAVMNLDGTHTVSGSSALHVHIDNAATAGGRLYARGAQPIFATTPTHLYGRMMMYIDPNGTSTHWTFFGADGTTAPGTPDAGAGRGASYIMSSLPKDGVNTYSFVYGLAATKTDAYHDCSSQSSTPMPSAWACVSFEMDSKARKLLMYKDGATTPILSVEDHGADCVPPTPTDDPWYGPAVTDLFVGAWSFHPMNAPLDVWIDDLVVDTGPIACP